MPALTPRIAHDLPLLEQIGEDGRRCRRTQSVKCPHRRMEAEKQLGKGTRRVGSGRVGAGVPAAVLTVANGHAMAGHLASLEARLGLSDDDFSGLSSGCEDDFSGDDQSVDNFNGGGAAVAGAQPELAVVDIVQDEPAGRERHRHRGVSPVVGAVQEICARGAEFCMLRAWC